MRESENRPVGAESELTARLKRDKAGDEVVQRRVRSALGRLASHPGAIKVSVYSRRVILNGPVAAAELDSILRSVARVRGVREVENQLEVFEQSGGASSLQGSGGPRVGRMRPAPLTRLLAAAVGTTAAIAGLRRRGSLGTVLTVFGVGLLARTLLDRSIQGPWNQDLSDRRDWKSEIPEQSQDRSRAPLAESPLSPTE